MPPPPKTPPGPMPSHAVTRGGSGSPPARLSAHWPRWPPALGSPSPLSRPTVTRRRPPPPMPPVPSRRAESGSPTAGTASSAAAQSPAVTASAVQAAQTQVITIRPWNPDGTPAGGITITGRAGGSCFGTAESTMRTDAWRCTAGDRILDPCFSPGSNSQDTSVLCMDGMPDRMVELSVPQGLPGNNDHVPGGPDIEPITVILANGARCSFVGGATSTLAGQRLDYGCDNGGDLVRVPGQTGSGVEHLLLRAQQRRQRLRTDHHGLPVTRCRGAAFLTAPVSRRCRRCSGQCRDGRPGSGRRTWGRQRWRCTGRRSTARTVQRSRCQASAMACRRSGGTGWTVRNSWWRAGAPCRGPRRRRRPSPSATPLSA